MPGTAVGHIGDILVRPDAVVAQDPPVDALAGFDVVVQFSRNLLNLQVGRSLAQHGVASLHAYVPWGATTLPALLLAAIPVHLRVMLSTLPARLDVRLSRPYLASLRWPPDVSAGDAGT